MQWDFTDGSLRSWRVKRAESINLSSEGLVLATAPEGTKLVSPMIARGLGIEASGKFLRIKVASERDGYAVLRIKGRTSIKMESFWLRGGSVTESYDLNLGAIFPSGDMVEALSIDLLTGGGSLTLQKIMIFEPAGLEWLFMSLSDLWRAETTTTEMINHIDGPRVAGLSFLVAAYIFTGFLFITVLAVFVIRKKSLLKSTWVSGSMSPVFCAFILAFIVAATLFAVRMEYRWATLYGQDSAVLSRDESGTRIFTLFSQKLPEFLRFMDYIKSVLPEGEAVRAATKGSGAGEYLRLARYRLLPVKSSEGADYIWSYNEPSVRYDESNMRLMDGGRVIASPVERVGVFGDTGKGTLYRVMDSNNHEPESLISVEGMKEEGV